MLQPFASSPAGFSIQPVEQVNCRSADGEIRTSAPEPLASKRPAPLSKITHRQPSLSVHTRPLLPALDQMISSVARDTRTQRAEEEGRVRISRATHESGRERNGG